MIKLIIGTFSFPHNFRWLTEKKLFNIKTNVRSYKEVKRPLIVCFNICHSPKLIKKIVFEYSIDLKKGTKMKYIAYKNLSASFNFQGNQSHDCVSDALDIIW